MSKFASLYKRHRSPPEIIQHAVSLYHRFNLSTRDIEDLLDERGIAVSYESVRVWSSRRSVQKKAEVIRRGSHR